MSKVAFAFFLFSVLLPLILAVCSHKVTQFSCSSTKVSLLKSWSGQFFSQYFSTIFFHIDNLKVGPSVYISDGLAWLRAQLSYQRCYTTIDHLRCKHISQPITIVRDVLLHNRFLLPFKTIHIFQRSFIENNRMKSYQDPHLCAIQLVQRTCVLCCQDSVAIEFCLRCNTDIISVSNKKAVYNCGVHNSNSIYCRVASTNARH